MKTTITDIIDTLVVFIVGLLLVSAGVAGISKSYDAFCLSLVATIGVVVVWGIGGMIADDIRRTKRNNPGK